MNWNFITQLEKIEKYLEMNGIEPVSVTSFGQNWSNTCHGFAGAGGNTLTSSQTTIIESYVDNNVVVHVFFDGAIAYHVVNPNEQFYKDMYNQRMCPVWDADKYNTPKDDLDEIEEYFPESMLTLEQIEIVKNMTRVQAIKYIKENGYGFDGLKSAAIYYDLYISKII